MPGETILSELKGGCLQITLNKPERMNAWDAAMRARLIAELRNAAETPDITSIVLTGAGNRAFCAGQDLNEVKDFSPAEADSWIDGFGALYRVVLGLEVPVVSALNGVAAGSAFQFVLLTDIRVGHSGTRMGQPEINSGIASITGPWIMREVFGLSRTIDLTLTGRLMEADEALRLGALHEVVDESKVLGRAREIAIELGAKPRTAMRLIKNRFFEVLEPSLDEAIGAAKRYHRISFESGEMQAETKRFLAAKGVEKGG